MAMSGCGFLKELVSTKKVKIKIKDSNNSGRKDWEADQKENYHKDFEIVDLEE